MFVFVLWMCRKALGNVSCTHTYLRNCLVYSLSKYHIISRIVDFNSNTVQFADIFPSIEFS